MYMKLRFTKIAFSERKRFSLLHYLYKRETNFNLNRCKTIHGKMVYNLTGNICSERVPCITYPTGRIAHTQTDPNLLVFREMASAFGQI